MSDETHTTQDSGSGPPRRSAPGQLRLELPQQSAPIERGRRPEGYDATGGAQASGILAKLLPDILPF
ncbi:hypothetical protein [Streptomyces coeruleofuscus]|uniref:Uncharacterized protein n=1 Tax=Streptomyces coeruleofuscus TaxID=66879 RepID=A0ABP5WLB3_9ACTN